MILSVDPLGEYRAREDAEQRLHDLGAAIIKVNDEWTKEVLAWKPGEAMPMLTGRIAQTIMDSELSR